MKLPSTKWSHGDTLYQRISPETPGMVTGIVVRPGPTILYLMAWADTADEREHYEIELTDERVFSAGGEGGGK